MPTEHRRRTDGNGAEMHERATDRDFWARLDLIAGRYKLAWVFWSAFAAGLGWLGREYLEPLKAVPQLQAQQVIMLQRQDRADSARTEMVQVLKVFGKFICQKMTAEERYQYDINCRALPRPEIIVPPPGPSP